MRVIFVAFVILFSTERIVLSQATTQSTTQATINATTAASLIPNQAAPSLAATQPTTSPGTQPATPVNASGERPKMVEPLELTDTQNVQVQLKWIDFWIAVPPAIVALISIFWGQAKRDENESEIGNIIIFAGIVIAFVIVAIAIIFYIIPNRTSVPALSSERLSIEVTNILQNQAFERGRELDEFNRAILKSQADFDRFKASFEAERQKLRDFENQLTSDLAGLRQKLSDSKANLPTETALLDAFIETRQLATKVTEENRVMQQQLSDIHESDIAQSKTLAWGKTFFLSLGLSLLYLPFVYLFFRYRNRRLWAQTIGP